MDDVCAWLRLCLLLLFGNSLLFDRSPNASLQRERSNKRHNTDTVRWVLYRVPTALCSSWRAACVRACGTHEMYVVQCSGAEISMYSILRLQLQTWVAFTPLHTYFSPFLFSHTLSHFTENRVPHTRELRSRGAVHGVCMGLFCESDASLLPRQTRVKGIAAAAACACRSTVDV